MPEPLFSVQDLVKHFPVGKNKVVKALDGVSFDVFRGETVSLVGESGCGKTTCGRTLLGVYPKTSGDIYNKGKRTDGLSSAEKKVFCKNNTMIFQDPYACLDPRMTISSSIEEGMNVHFTLTAKERAERVREVLGKVGLTHDYVSRFPHELSGGQRQRVGIARALALEPEFIVCDEPIAALDVSIQAQVVNLLMELQQKEQLTYLFISHDLSMIRHISDRIVVMYLGAVVETAGAKELYDNPQHPYAKALFSAIPRADVERSWAENRIRLTGEVPSPINAPPGCKFHTRCAYATEQCKQVAPVLKKCAPGHALACHMFD